MDRKQFARFIKLLKEANERGEDVDAIMKAYEHVNAYIYNDGVFKKIFASEENIALTTDLVNASLDLFGCDCISHARIVNPFVPGDTGNSSVEPDIMLVNDRGVGQPRDRICRRQQSPRAMAQGNRHSQPRGRFQRVFAGPRVQGIAKCRKNV